MPVLMLCRMLADAEYFSSRISKLDGAGDLGEHIVNVVKAKAVVSESASPVTAPEEKAEERPDSANGQEEHKIRV